MPRIYTRLPAEELRKRVRERRNKWRALNKDKVNKLFKEKYALKSRYNMTLDDKMDMFRKQKWTCPICLKRLKDDRTSHIDHCHTTGKVRGILCNSCNTSIGRFNDDITIFHRAIEYIVNGGI